MATESHRVDGATVTAVAAARVRARRRLGAAIRGVKVIYWSQTNAGNAAIVVIPMDWMSRFQPLAPRRRPSRRLQVLKPIVHTLERIGQIDVSECSKDVRRSKGE